MKTYKVKKENKKRKDIVVEVSEDKTEAQTTYYTLNQLEDNLKSYQKQKKDVEVLITSTKELISEIDSNLKK